MDLYRQATRRITGQGLPPRCTKVLVARYLNELSYGEIADILGCSVPTAYVRCKRARERLRTLLLQADEEETRRRCSVPSAH